jgi:hypothetical protein
MPLSGDNSRLQTHKRPYRTPALKVLGDFQKLTAAKGGTQADGSGKPRTRLFGSNA